MNTHRNRCWTLFTVICLLLSVASISSLSASDLNTSTYQGHAHSVTWVQDFQFNTMTFDQVVATVWSYDPHPQLLQWGCLQNAKMYCIDPAFLACKHGEGPLEITQLNPPAGWPVRVTRKCLDPSPGEGGCRKVVGYYNDGAGRGETTQAAGVVWMTEASCTAK
jgi:hypothetical protein